MQHLRYVYWIGGVSCSGKTIVARILARRYGLDIYSSDDHFDRHARRPDTPEMPTPESRVQDPDTGEWRRPPGPELADLWLDYYRARFPAIVADLGDSRMPIIAEGVDILPDLVLPRAWGRQAVWLVPTRTFRAKSHHARETSEGRTSKSDTDDRWAYLKRMIDVMNEHLNPPGHASIVVDGSRTPEELADELASRWRLGERQP